MTWLAAEDKHVEFTQNVIIHWDNDHSSTKGQCTSHDVTLKMYVCVVVLCDRLKPRLEVNAVAVNELERSMWKDMVEQQTTMNKEVPAMDTAEFGHYYLVIY